jgi:N-acetylmuramoyl-L-alanine amidase
MATGRRLRGGAAFLGLAALLATVSLAQTGPLSGLAGAEPTPPAVLLARTEPSQPLVPREQPSSRGGAAVPGNLATATTTPLAPAAAATALGATPVTVPARLEVTRKVVLDPGHAGQFNGASTRLANGQPLAERDVNLKVALQTADLLRQAGATVVLTRTTDTAVNAAGRDLNGDGAEGVADDLQARADLANREQADVFVSIHFNAGAAGARGTEVYYNANRSFSSQSKQLATNIFDRLVAGIRAYGYNTQARGVKKDSEATGGAPFFILGPAGGTVARASQMPAALGEGLFLSYPEEAQLLASDVFLAAVARAYADGITDYLKR